MKKNEENNNNVRGEASKKKNKIKIDAGRFTQKPPFEIFRFVRTAD